MVEGPAVAVVPAQALRVATGPVALLMVVLVIAVVLLLMVAVVAVKVARVALAAMCLAQTPSAALEVVAAAKEHPLAAACRANLVLA